jgi:single-strand DNA-binding protein
MNINHITISGRLGADAELKYTQNKLAILNFSIAQGDYQKDGTTKPMWFNVIVFDKYAEALATTLKKGDEVIVAGKLKVRSYQQRDGVERTVVEITANGVRILTYRQKAEPSPQMTSSDPKLIQQPIQSSFSEDEIPF